MTEIKFEDLSDRDQKVVEEFRIWLWSKIKPDMSNVHISINIKNKRQPVYINFNDVCGFYTSGSDMLNQFMNMHDYDDATSIRLFIEDKNYFLPTPTKCYIDQKSISIS